MQRYSFAAPAKNTGSTTKSGSTATTSEWKKSTFPPKGTTPEEHARKMRNLKPEMTKGRCAFCKTLGHGATTCWRLNPDLRPEDYRPRIEGIWWFKGSKPSEASNAAVGEIGSDDENPYILNFSGLAVANATNTSLRWIYDTGSSQHLTPDCASLSGLHQLKPHEYYQYGTSNGGIGVAKSAGYLTLTLAANGQNTVLKIKAYHQPDLPYGLLSSNRLRTDLGIYATTKDLTLRRDRDDKIVGHLQASKNVLFVRTKDPDLALAAVDPLLLHRRYGHAGFRRIATTAKDHQIELEHRDTLECEACSLGKATRLVSRDPIPKTNDPTQLWHADIQKVTPIGHGGFNYFLLMVNNATRLVRTAMLKHKDDASDELIRMNMEHKNMVGRYVATWHLDGGREFNRFRKWANHAERGIQIKISPPRTPEANGLAERYGGLLNRMSRVMILDAGLPAHLWPYAVRLSAQILNRLVPYHSAVRKTPVFLYRSHYNLPNPNASLDFLRVFGCRAYQHIPQEDRVASQKMGPRAKVGYFVGFDGDNGHVYYVWDPISDKIKRSRDVKFNEDRTYKDDKEDPGGVPTREPDPKGPTPAGPGAALKLDNAFLHQTTNISDNTRALIEQPDPEEDVIRGRIHTISASAEPPPTRSIENATEYEASSTKYAAQDYRLPDPTEPEEQPILRRSARTTKGKSSTWPGYQQLATVDRVTLPHLKQHEVVVPNTYSEAMKSPLAPYWKDAMDTQIDKIQNMGTYEIVNRPPTARAIPGKWVYDLKVNTDGFVTQFRARWVVCGNRQIPGIDYDESFAPVASEAALKLFMTNVAIKDLEWEQCDIVSAYLHAQIQGKRVFMKQPTGYHEGPPDQVCLLKMALYGLRQAAHLWHQTFDETLKRIGFEPLREDPCVYKKGDIWLIIYVDDSAIAGPRKEDLAEVKQHLNKAFGLKEMGEPKVLLGCNVQRDYQAGTISLSQPTYVEECLNAANLGSCTPSAIPMTVAYKKSDRSNMTTENVNLAEYQSLTSKAHEHSHYGRR
ncbi:hypothetical protein CBS147482_10946 [Aspergillus niger]|nr:hypothetical protein CBS147482_10946 [Aspergillus niger]